MEIPISTINRYSGIHHLLIVRSISGLQHVVHARGGGRGQMATRCNPCALPATLNSDTRIIVTLGPRRAFLSDFFLPNSPKITELRAFVRGQ